MNIKFIYCRLAKIYVSRFKDFRDINKETWIRTNKQTCYVNLAQNMNTKRDSTLNESMKGWFLIFNYFLFILSSHKTHLIYIRYTKLSNRCVVKCLQTWMRRIPNADTTLHLLNNCYILQHPLLNKTIIYFNFTNTLFPSWEWVNVN